jgi:hypothetical protein
VLFACSHPVAPASTAVKSPSACERISDHLVSLMSASSVASDEQLDPYRRLIATRCEQDLWTQAAKDCFLATTSLADGDRCQSLLTPSQQQLLERDGMAAVDAAHAQQAAPPQPQPAPDAEKNSDPCEGGQRRPDCQR